MNRDDIIRWAREAAMVRKEGQWGVYFHEVSIPDLMRFANLVAAAEREACIEDCEALGDSWRQGYLDGVKSCIAVIRARGEK